MNAQKFLLRHSRALSTERNKFVILCVALVALALAPYFLSADSLVNINTADKETLMTLSGIGEVKAQAIIDYRTTTPFVVIEDIMNVSGIGPATFESIKNQITVGTTEPSTQPTTQPASQTTTQTSSGSGSQTSSVVTISRASAGSDRTVFVGTTVRFEGYAYDSSNKRIDETRFQWAFGDGTAAEGRVVVHRYDIPGRYAVALKATRYESSATHRIVVTVEEPRVVLTLLPQGGISITNNSEEDLDLSRWLAQDGTVSFTFPEETYLIGGETLFLTVATLKYYPTSNVALYLPTGGVAATIATESEVLPEAPVQTVTEVFESGLVPEEEFFLDEDLEEVKEASPLIDTLSVELFEERVISGAETQVAAAAAAGHSFSFSLFWWGGMALLALLGGAAVFVTRRFRAVSPTSDSSTTHVDIKDWNIIDEGEEK